MEKYILITAVVIMIIILALDFIFSKDGSMSFMQETFS